MELTAERLRHEQTETKVQAIEHGVADQVRESSAEAVGKAVAQALQKETHTSSLKIAPDLKWPTLGDDEGVPTIGRL